MRRGTAEPLVLAGLVALALAAGCGGTRIGAGGAERTGASSIVDGSPITYAPTTGPAADEVFSSPRLALRSILRSQFAGSAVESASFGAPPPGAPLAGKAWVHVTVAARDTAAGATLGDWEAAMLVGELRDDLHASNLPAMSGYSITLRSPDGARSELGGGGAGNIAFDQGFVTGALDAIRKRLLVDASAAGATIESLSFLRTRDPAPVVTMTAPHAKAFVAAHPSLTGVFRSSGPFEGIYVVLLDRAGRPIEVGSAALRSGIGDAWYAPGYAGGDRGRG